jgi:L-cysteine/cystine lyase
MDLQVLRQSIALTEEQIYMNTGWVGPSPQPVLDIIRDAFELEACSGPASLEGLALARRSAEEARVAVAGLLNAEADDILLTHGTTEGVYVVLHGYPWQPGDELLTCNLEHSAVATPAAVLEERSGVTVRRVELAPDASAGEILEAIAAALTPKTRIVALSHIEFTCGLRLPMAQIIRLAHEAGAFVLVDGAQTGGAIAIDVKELGADFYSISGQKWLLGPQGTGAMYFNRDHMDKIEPLFTTHNLVNNRALATEVQSQATLNRYRVASQSPALLVGFAKAVATLQEIGVSTIEAHSLEMAADLRGAVSSIPGVAITGPRDSDVACGLVALSIKGWQPAEIVRELWHQRRIAARAVNHPPAVRFSLHGFNTHEEVALVVEAIEDIAGREPEA